MTVQFAERTLTLEKAKEWVERQTTTVVLLYAIHAIWNLTKGNPLLKKKGKTFGKLLIAKLCKSWYH
jgi:hypothetical protein